MFETRGDRTWLVALAAAMWGTDGLWRMPLATALPAGTVVLYEHLIIVLVLAPALPGALRALRACRWRERVAAIVLGVGASALATALFTAAFAVGDPVTPLVLQKLQPIFAALASFLLLGERVRGRWFAFAVPALVGAWLLAFADPLDVTVSRLLPAVLTIGAAVLWASGTVLGRMLSRRIASRDVTALRFACGLPAAALVVVVREDPIAIGWSNVSGVLLLALIPGLLALRLYYFGMAATPAARATLAELSFPATAAILGLVVFDAHFTATQWLGFVLTVGAVAALGWHERVSREQVVTAPPVPACSRSSQPS